MSSTAEKVASPPPPQPLADALSQEFWDHAAKGELALRRCDSCGTWQFPPVEFCHKCGGHDFTWHAVSGKGSIYTYLIEHHKVAPGFDDVRPYAIALVNPDEAPDLRIPGRIIDAPLEAVKIGRRVEAVFLDHPGGDYKMAVWRITH